MTAFAQHVRVRAAAGRREELAAKFAETVEFLAGNPDCLLTLVCRDSDDQDVVTLTEVWTSRAAHHATVTSDAVQRWAAGVGELTDGPPDVEPLDPVAWCMQATVPSAHA